MENYMSNSAQSAMSYAERFDQMYPDLYTRVYPHVQYLVDSIMDESLHNITNEDVERISQEAMRRGNVLADPPSGHNAQTMGDMTRALVVRGLHDRHRRNRFFPFPSPFFPPFFFFPYDGDDRYRDFRDRDRDRDRDMGWDRYR